MLLPLRIKSLLSFPYTNEWQSRPGSREIWDKSTYLGEGSPTNSMSNKFQDGNPPQPKSWQREGGAPPTFSLRTSWSRVQRPWFWTVLPTPDAAAGAWIFVGRCSLHYIICPDERNHPSSCHWNEKCENSAWGLFSLFVLNGSPNLWILWPERFSNLPYSYSPRKGVHADFLAEFMHPWLKPTTWGPPYPPALKIQLQVWVLRP